MPRKYPNLPRIFEILDEMSGKQPCFKIRDLLLSEDLLPPPDAMEYYTICTREVIQQHGRVRTREGEIQQRLFHIQEVTDDGETIDNYVPGHELTLDDGVELLKYEIGLSRGQNKKCWDIFNMLADRFGKRTVLRQLRIPLPEQMAELAGAGD